MRKLLLKVRFLCACARVFSLYFGVREVRETRWDVIDYSMLEDALFLLGEDKTLNRVHLFVRKNQYMYEFPTSKGLLKSNWIPFCFPHALYFMHNLDVSLKAASTALKLNATKV